MVAPTPVSALLHAVAVVKAGVFSVVKVIVYVFGVDLLVATPGTHWLFYMAGRMGHYMPSYRADTTIKALPEKEIAEYLTSDRFFVAPEAEDPLLPLEMELVGEDHVLFGSDFPHGEGRENAAAEIKERADITEPQRAKFLYDNAVRLFGEP